LYHDLWMCGNQRNDKYCENRTETLMGCLRTAAIIDSESAKKLKMKNLSAVMKQDIFTHFACHY